MQCACMHACMHVCMYACMHAACLLACLSVWMYGCMDGWMCIYIYMYCIIIYVRISVYTSTIHLNIFTYRLLCRKSALWYWCCSHPDYILATQGIIGLWLCYPAHWILSLGKARKPKGFPKSTSSSHVCPWHLDLGRLNMVNFLNLCWYKIILVSCHHVLSSSILNFWPKICSDHRTPQASARFSVDDDAIRPDATWGWDPGRPIHKKCHKIYAPRSLGL